MLGKKTLLAGVVLIAGWLTPTPVQAAKERPWKTPSARPATVSTATRPVFSVRFRSDRRAITVYFNSVNTTSSISYELTYNGNGLDQGVAGAVYPKEGNSTSRLLLFGTCSHNVCSYHRHVQNARLTITGKLNSGKTLIKRYTIRV